MEGTDAPNSSNLFSKIQSILNPLTSLHFVDILMNKRKLISKTKLPEKFQSKLDELKLFF